MPYWLFICLKIIILGLILVFSFLLVKLSTERKIITNSFKKVYKLFRSRARQRLVNEERIRYESGKQEKIGFLSKLDVLIFRSGLHLVLPFLNSEIYLSVTIVLAILVFFVTQTLINSIFGLMASVVFIVISYLILYLLSGNNYKKTEKTLINFANLLENYSKTSDDIIDIFRKVLPYMDNPIRAVLEECCMTALTTGQISTSLNQMSNKIEHEKFKELVRNLEICSRYEANYAEIITESKKNLREYIAAKEERKEMKNSSKVDMILLLSASVIIIKVVEQMGNNSVFAVLTGSLIGNLIILYCLIVILVIIFLFFTIEK